MATALRSVATLWLSPDGNAQRSGLSAGHSINTAIDASPGLRLASRMAHGASATW